MKPIDMNTTGKILAGVLLGGVIGAVTALLLAPSTGRTTRKNLNKKAKKLVKKLEGAIGQKGNKKKASQVSTHIKNGRAAVASR
jgi:gas vesicle protein